VTKIAFIGLMLMRPSVTKSKQCIHERVMPES